MAQKSESKIDQLTFVSTNRPFILNLDEFRQQKLYTDFSLSCADHDVPCHRLVLRGRSKFFATMPEESSYKLKIEATSEVLDTIVSFLYTGEILLNSSNYLSIFEIAIELQLGELFEACQRFFAEKVTPTVDNWWNIYRMTSKYIQRDDVKEYVRPLQQSVERMLRDEFRNIYQTDEFLHISVDTLKYLLEADRLNVAEEEQVLRAVARWIREFDSRTAFTADLLQYVRLPFLELKSGEFLEMRNDKTFQSDDCQQLFEKAMRYCAIPGERWFMSSKSTIPRPSTGMTNSLVVITVDQSLVITWVIRNPEQLKSLKTEGPSAVWCIPKPVSSDAMVFEYCSNFYLLDVTTNQLYLTGVEDFGKWHPADTPLHLKRKRCSWVTVGNQTWFIGGVDENGHSSPTVEWFDWETWKLEQGPSLPCAVQQSCAFHALGKVYVLGGQDASGAATRHVQVFDMKLQKWTLLADRLPVPVCEKNAIAYGGKVHLPFGKTIASYDLLSDQITSIPSSAAIDDDHCEGPCHLAVVNDDIVIFRGGSFITVISATEGDVANSSLQVSKDGTEVLTVDNKSSPVDNLWGMWTGKQFFFSLNLPQFAFNFPRTSQDETELSNDCMKVVQFTIPKISKCAHKLKRVVYRSVPFTLHDVVWSLSAEKKHSQGKTVLGLFLCNDSFSEKRVHMNAKVEARLVHRSDRSKDIRHVFSDPTVEHGSCGFPCFITFDELLSPGAGYADETSDSVQFRIIVVVSPCLEVAPKVTSPSKRCL